MNNLDAHGCHVTNHLITSNDKDSNSEMSEKLGVCENLNRELDDNEEIYMKPPPR
jgi:hypothetical protein